MNSGQPVTITIRQVPADVRDELAASAVRAGLSLEDYLLQALCDLARRPSTAATIDRARRRARVLDTRVPVDHILGARDTDRR